MAKNYSEYLSELIEKYSTYSSPTEAQKLIILLGSKTDRTTDEDKRLKILVNAERTHQQASEARQKARDVLNADKNEKRKIETRKKIIWGAALKTAATDNPKMAQIMVKLYEGGYIADKDKNAVLDDYNTAKSNRLTENDNPYGNINR